MYPRLWKTGGRVERACFPFFPFFNIEIRCILKDTLKVTLLSNYSIVIIENIFFDCYKEEYNMVKV